MALQPVRRSESLKDRACAEIRQMVLGGRLQPGEVVSGSRIAQALRISRTPVREALLDLCKEGLVEAVPRRGVVVRPVTPQERREVFLLRRAIEGLLAEQAVGRLTPADLQRLRRVLARQREATGADDVAAFLDADEELHLIIAQRTGLRRAAAILATLRDLSRLMGLEAVRHAGRGEAVLAEHERILDAIEAGDVAAARRAMLDHIDRTEAVLDPGAAVPWP